MKNFTNNFKQFTSCLSARWLIMAFMLLAGAGNAWGVDIYIYSTEPSNHNLYLWNHGTSDCNVWPGCTISNLTRVAGNLYKKTVNSGSNMILSKGGNNQTGDITNIVSDKFYYCDGTSFVEKTSLDELISAAGYSATDYTSYYVAGSFNDWNVTGLQFNNFSKDKLAYSVEYTLNPNTYTFKVTKGNWNNTYNGKDNLDNTRGDGTLTLSNEGGNDNNIKFTISTSQIITFYIDPVEGKVFAEAADACDDVASPTLSIDQGITDDCGNVTNGIIAIDNYASFEDCTFTLNGNQVTPTNTGKIEGVTTSGSCTVVVTNNCGNSSEPVSIDMTETTIKAPRTDFTVSLSYPQVAFAANNGSVYIDLSGSERNVTYYLYKNDVKVLESEKLGEGEALRWTVLESGTYTVKADNPCNGEIAMAGQVDFTCMSNLELAFEGGKSVFCPGETTNVIVTFDGDGKGNETTNYGKFGWKWEGSNYTYQSVYLTESGVTMPVTINANGSIQLNVKTCNGTLSSNLNFTVVTAPEEPLLDRYAKEICTGETAEITISPYDNACTYKLYKDVNEVETPEFNAGVFTVSEAGSYTIKAVEQECNIESTPSDPFNLTVNGTTITQSPEVVHPYEVVTFTAGEQVKWALYTNPSSGSQLSDEDAKYSGKDTAYITKGESTTTKFKGEAANGYVIHATVGDCTASYTFNVVEDPDNCQ